MENEEIEEIEEIETTSEFRVALSECECLFGKHHFRVLEVSEFWRRSPVSERQ
ncbi:MAG: hypothetical protein LBE64_14635 [Acinetobacter pittii]|nr:hypothetical protein [Acinetobacter pittii]